jgi:DNA-binding IclR family transcriptional regulator
LLMETDSITLKDLAEKTGLKKPNLCDILNSLIELDYVKKTNISGEYCLGEKLTKKSFLSRKKQAIISISEKYSTHLSNYIHETITIATIIKGERCTIAHATSNVNSISVNPETFKVTSFYENTNGRILLAFLDEKTKQNKIKEIGLPGELWKTVTNINELENELSEIRKNKIAMMLSTDGLAQFVSMPVFGPDEKVWLSIAINMPVTRFKGKKQTKFFETLKKYCEKMSAEFKVQF